MQEPQKKNSTIAETMVETSQNWINRVILSEFPKLKKIRNSNFRFWTHDIKSWIMWITQYRNFKEFIANKKTLAHASNIWKNILCTYTLNAFADVSYINTQCKYAYAHKCNDYCVWRVLFNEKNVNHQLVTLFKGSW